MTFFSDTNFINLISLQKNGNIPITGLIDEKTVDLMKKPRCGVGDGALNVRRHKRYALMTSKWQKTDLTWRFVLISRGIAKAILMPRSFEPILPLLRL